MRPRGASVLGVGQLNGEVGSLSGRLYPFGRRCHVGLELRDMAPHPLPTVTDLDRQMGQGSAHLVMAQI